MQLFSKSKLSLSLALALCLYGQSAWAAANTGGIADKPDNGDYAGSIDGINTTNTGANVTINTDVTGDVYGGYTADDNTAVYNNQVTVKGGTLDSVEAGRVDHLYHGMVYDNTLIIEGGTIDSATAGSTHGDAINNTVRMTQGTVGLILGASGGQRDPGQTVRGNKVFISGGTVTRGIAAGQSEQSAHMIDNAVEISGGTITDDVMITGGFVTYTGIIEKNSVTIKGGYIGDNVKIYGGYGGAPDAITDNTITIEGTPTIGANLELYGGYNDAGPVVDIRTGNTLNIYLSGLAAKTVDNFQHYDLALDKNNVTLTVTDALTLQAGDTIRSTRVLSELNVGDSFTILKVDNGLDLNGATLINGEARKGALYIYNYKLSQDVISGDIIAEIVAREQNKQTMSVADGQLAAMGMLRSGADLISGSAMTTAAQNVKKYDVFASMNYGNYHINSVSNIDVQGTSMLVGMSRNLQHTNSNTTIGAFLESGWGTYDSELGEARAKGHTNYYGLGVLARHNNNSGIYTEGSLRVGKVGNTYSGHKADDGMYDASSTYYGLHLGIGKINKINDKTSTDIYAKYFYAHENGTDATLLGDKFDFDSIDSHRIRIGARLNNTNKNITRYVGLAYEYEFSGTARASAYGMDIASPSAKGSSGLLELGVTYKPATDSRFSMDLGLTGYAGKRQGVGGNLNLNWAF